MGWTRQNWRSPWNRTTMLEAKPRAKEDDASHSGCASATSGCSHHWIIESARGNGSCKGVCRLCGAVKQFDDRGADSLYEREQNPLAAGREIPWRREADSDGWDAA